MQEQLDAYEVIKMACGTDEEDNPKASVVISLEEWEEKNSNNLGSCLLDKAIVQMQQRDEFMIVDLEFGSSSDSNLAHGYNLLNKFGDSLELLTEESTKFPAFTITIVPLEYKEHYFITCLNPILWAITPKIAGLGANILRLLFKIEACEVYQTDEIDLNKIEAEAEQKMKHDAYINSHRK